MNSSELNQYDHVKAELLSVLPRLHRYARNISVGRIEAEDLLQATSERVLSRWQQFRPGTDFDRWAFTIMLSIRNNQLRSEAVRMGHGHEDAAETLIAPESQSPERNKINQQVFASIEELPAAQQQVILLVYVEGFSYSAAAEILDIPVGTVMSRIGRARVRLAAELNASGSSAVAPAGTTPGTRLVNPRGAATLSESGKPVSSARPAESSLHTVYKR